MPQPIVPWKSLFLSLIQNHTPATFTLSTLSTSSSSTNPLFPPNNPTTAPTILPRCRTMIFRGLLFSAPKNPHNPIPARSLVLESDNLTFTTNSLSTKTTEFLPLNSPAPGSETETFGGGEAEACFWIPSTDNQFRIRGRVYLLSERDVGERKEVTEKLYPGLDGKEWEDEVERHWGNMTPNMRGTFANPPPGVPLSEVSGEKGGVVENEAVGRGGEEKARRNFRVGVLVPEVVERVALNEDFGKAKRWVWDKDDGGEWRETELWP